MDLPAKDGAPNAVASAVNRAHSAIESRSVDVKPVEDVLKKRSGRRVHEVPSPSPDSPTEATPLTQPTPLT